MGIELLDIPDKYEYEKARQKKEITDRNNRNRRRGREMEIDVMRRLGGQRVPFSGSGSMKGDGYINLPGFGTVIVECKLSAAIFKRASAKDKHIETGGKYIDISKAWFTKLEKERKNMRAKAAIVVAHFHKSQSHLVLIDRSMFERLFGSLGNEPAFVHHKEGTKTFKLVKSKTDSLKGSDYALYTFDDLSPIIVVNLEYFILLLEIYYPYEPV